MVLKKARRKAGIVAEENNFTAETCAVFYDALPTTVRNW
jgi:hypothetical protein